MTVQDLIEKLKEYPSDAVVIYRAWSDWNELETGEIKLLTADESKEMNEANPSRKYQLSEAVVKRGGRFCNAYPLSQYPPGESPEYVTVVTLPGN